MSDCWVVVGAGTAGCVVGARLSERADREVTVLEAGPDLRPGERAAAIDAADSTAAVALTERTRPELVAIRPDGSAHPYARGRGVGGSSVVNAMLASRGDDAERWGWSDAAEAWRRVALPAEVATEDELGPVDRALLAAAPDAAPALLTRRDGRRITSAEAYLWPAFDRVNLQVRSDVVVDRVLFDGRRAVGVRLVGGEELTADRVVLCAGAIHTPAILLRSGVDTAGVGETLQDHPSATLTLELCRPADPATLLVGAVLDRGPLEVISMNHTAVGSSLGALGVALMRPTGRHGKVELASSDPTVEPRLLLDPLADRRDLASLVAGVRLLMELLGSTPFRELVEQVYVDDQGTTVDRLRDDAAIRRWLPTAAAAYVHAASTCPIGAVLDADGALRGYEHLYVCDASAFPQVPGVGPQLPTTMLAELLVPRFAR